MFIARRDLCSFQPNSVNAFFLEIGSENTMRKLKRDSVASLVKQEVGFFDEKEASVGGLTGMIATHSSNVGSATGMITAQVLIAFTNLLGSIVIGMILDWRIALVGLPSVTFLLFWVRNAFI
jgi:ATP-binding cassette subfamily B (MDR/TAP) protein 1